MESIRTVNYARKLVSDVWTRCSCIEYRDGLVYLAGGIAGSPAMITGWEEFELKPLETSLRFLDTVDPPSTTTVQSKSAVDGITGFFTLDYNIAGAYLMAVDPEAHWQ